jgi:hypothetical protein
MSDADCQFIELPGIHNEIKSLNRQLDAFHDHLGHIIVKGPKGVGKSQFVQIVKERLWNYKAEDAEFKTIDCESITKEELADWKSFAANGNELIILENLQCFPVEEFKALSALLKRVRVIATTRSDLPKEFTDNFKISVEVPSLYKRRDDIFHFIAWKYPSIFLTNVDLIRLYAYPWPGNFPELDRAIWRLKAEHKFPPDIDKKVPEEKLCSLFDSMYGNGCQIPALFLTHDTCFSHLIPAGDSELVSPETVELRFANNDPSSDIEASINPEISNTILNGQEVRRIFKCFFGLIYGRGATSQDQSIFDLQPFTAESLKFVMQAQQDVFQWKIEDAYSSDYDFNHSYFQHFSESLKQEEIDAAVSYLKSCLSACEAACPIVHVETPKLITLKEATEEGYLNKSELLRQAEEGADKLELLFYVKYEDIVKAASLPDLTTVSDLGDYLVIPHNCIKTLMEHDELEIQTFFLSRVYPPSPGLLAITMCLTGEEGKKINTLRTVKRYIIKLPECFDKIKVVRQQAEKFYKKRLAIPPHSIIQGAHVDSGQETDQDFARVHIHVQTAPQQGSIADNDEYAVGNLDIEIQSGLSFNTFKKYFDLFNESQKTKGLAEIKIEKTQESKTKNKIKKADIRRVIAFKKQY